MSRRAVTLVTTTLALGIGLVAPGVARADLRLPPRALGPTSACLVAKPVRALLRRTGLSGADGALPVEPRAATQRPTAQQQNHPARATPSRSSGRGETVIHRPPCPAWRLHTRLLVQAVRTALGCVLHHRPTRPTLDAPAAPHRPYPSIATRPRLMLWQTRRDV